MKKFIPILSIAIASVFMQNCTNRDENIISDHHQLDEIEMTMMMRVDSTRSNEEIIDQDPPVRDGDNWRIIPNN